MKRLIFNCQYHKGIISIQYTHLSIPSEMLNKVYLKDEIMIKKFRNNIKLSIFQQIYVLSVCLSISISIYLFVYLAGWLSFHLSLCLPIHLHVCLSICLKLFENETVIYTHLQEKQTPHKHLLFLQINIFQNDQQMYFLES